MVGSTRVRHLTRPKMSADWMAETKNKESVNENGRYGPRLGNPKNHSVTEKVKMDLTEDARGSKQADGSEIWLRKKELEIQSKKSATWGKTGLILAIRDERRRPSIVERVYNWPVFPPPVFSSFIPQFLCLPFFPSIISIPNVSNFSPWNSYVALPCLFWQLWPPRLLRQIRIPHLHLGARPSTIRKMWSGVHSFRG